MDENDIDAALERLANLVGGRYDPQEFWDWVEGHREEAYDSGYQQGRANALDAL